MNRIELQNSESLTRAKSSIFFTVISFNEDKIYFEVKKDLEKYFLESSYESTQMPKWILQKGEKGDVGNNTKILSFRRKINREELPYVKKKCLKICEKFIKKDNSLKIIPGYLSEQNTIIASSFDDLHRVYIFHGVYAEIVYVYEAGKFVYQTHSPQFFSTKESIYFFKNLRESIHDNK
ncbi:MAG: DUF4416 family protein [Leptospiraceae bacterium]|nr:DUF4416 family protein [Leptospiraceae bacterium]MCK6380444.1 DUF4416 family protein [Leptospiraceae bacterium]NUM40698.1 DUF4416 family protein [Leptospiraceae bacterium]